jgi:hypothetical protein
MRPGLAFGLGVALLTVTAMLVTKMDFSAGEVQAQQEPQATPVLATPSPMATATVMLPSPTPDYGLATAMAMFAGQTGTAQAVNLEMSRNNAVLGHAIETQNAIDQTAIPLTQTAAPGAATATKSAESTQVAEAIARRTEVAYAPTAIVARAQADADAQTATWRAWGSVFATFALGVTCLLIGVVAVGAIRRQPAPVVEETKVFHVVNKPGQIERVPAPPVQDYESFRDWAAAVVAGETVSVDFWEQAGRFVGNYRKVHSWLVRWRLVMRHPKTGRAVLNGVGEQVLTHWLIDNPLPHSSKSPKTAPPPSVHTDSVITEAEGEGLAEESE